jgi:L-2,4-diaminobutyric acid acetyltransferase
MLQERPLMPAFSVSHRSPLQRDARSLHELTAASGTLDLNSRYTYLLICNHFSGTSVVAECEGRVVGFVSGYRLPEHSDTLFIWQITVDPQLRGRGIAREMLNTLVRRQLPQGVRFVEATVSPGNEFSRRLFWGLAHRFSTGCTETQGYDASLFLPQVHEAEPLIRIGPFPVAFPQDVPQKKGTV